MLSKKVKLSLDYKQKMVLETLSNEHRLLYNYLLEKVKDNLDFKQINENYKTFRLSNSLTINSKSAQNTSIGLINNIKSYLSLKKKDKTARFPSRFKSYKYFTSFMLDYNNGCGGFAIHNNTLSLNLNSVKNKIIFDLPEYVSDINNTNIKTITFKREGRNYYLIFVYQEQSKKQNLNPDNFLSIDLGYSSLVTACSKHENFKISNMKQKKLNQNINILNSIRDEHKRNSRRYKKINNTLKRKKRTLSDKQKDFQHKASKKIVDFCVSNDIGTIYLGDMKVKSIVKKENKKINGLSKSTSSIGRFKMFLDYKAKNVGIDMKLVDERDTSKTNSLTEKIEFDSSLKNRSFEFEGLIIDRDVNSTVNFLIKSGLCLSQDSKLNLLLNPMSELIV